MNKPIGVFDSGIGGITVLKELIRFLPEERFIYLADSANAPYGVLPEEKIRELSARNVEFLLSKECKLIVIACNTATAAAVNQLRQMYSVPIVGLEPAIKPACLASKTKNVAVLATKGTFRGNHFRNTSEKYKDYVNLHLKVAKGLVEIAEEGEFGSEKAEKLILKYLKHFENKNIDHLVLGCTHYPFFSDIIRKIVGKKIIIVDSSEAVARRTKDVLIINKVLNRTRSTENHKFFTSGSVETLRLVAQYYLNIDTINLKVEKIK
jgi:glutamate racemase